MIGVGKYKVNIDHMFFKGEAVFEIEFENGNTVRKIKEEEIKETIDEMGINFGQYVDTDVTYGTKYTNEIEKNSTYFAFRTDSHIMFRRNCRTAKLH